MNKGVSLIELLITISVVIFLIGTSIVSYRFFEKGAELENTAQHILATLKLAQTKTLASEDASPYGIHFEADKYILFKGDIYQPSAVDNQIHQLANRLEIYDIDLADGGNDIVFQRISGQANQNGTTSLRIISQPTRTKTITIRSSGQIELEASLAECCITNRLFDSRHLHFNLGWSIQGAATLTLYFPDIPEVSTNINMADYFNTEQTEFDWTRTIDVNGQNQELHIHTHFLDAVDTILCIHRDKDKNNKPLQVLIDGRDVVSYAADGEATIGLWGGTMEIQ